MADTFQVLRCSYRANRAGFVIQNLNRLIAQPTLCSGDFKLAFYKNKVNVQSNGTIIELPDARFIGRAFRRCGCSELIIPNERIFERPTNERLSYLLEIAYQEKINELKLELDRESHLIIVPSEQIDVPTTLPGIKHYTDEQGYYDIRATGHINGSRRRNDRSDDYRVYLTRLSLGPRDIRAVLADGEIENNPKKGTYVIAFDLKDGSPKVYFPSSDESREGYVSGNLYLSDVGVLYGGLNPIHD